MTNVFVAYASGNNYHSQIIEDACKAASTSARAVTAWSQQDTSGAPIARSVESWIDAADAFVADVSFVNVNVTYELGYAIGRGMPTPDEWRVRTWTFRFLTAARLQIWKCWAVDS